ncbi:methylenetetrahydrofolate reductase [NAD(P)H] [Adhaeribacter pallidiroseus]|uniref:Methylenetetrahydrofolate reductase n=1 Tax=Adhaeribacter pallidiroseus TaxID=2072847 RepID=A0A369QJU8_9BACT|nr:methylenetetrahydrofolate reductase [NAD(P)H] [Adhaeribacter pallidiroseus]RDC65213.1 Methylenetetrahydrofolate reductase (NAD(P)H) [Adhaeribacter pallidiroseus]
MKVTEHIANATKTLFSFEILPPVKGTSIQSIYNGIDPLMEFKPPFINVTYHREEYVFKERENGLLEKISIRKRPGTVGICSAIMHKYNVDAVPHIICGGFSREETENALMDLNFLGIDNVLVLRGDSIKTETQFRPHPDGHAYASDLLKQICDLNNGNYLDEDIANPVPTNFCAGVAGYPEKHSEAPNLEIDLKYLKMKVDMGAQYIITQMFFDNQKYFNFVKACREHGINVPIIPGIKPLTVKNQLRMLPNLFHIDIPNDLVQAIDSAPTPQAVRQVGIEWATQQCKELVQFGVPCLHFYTMSKSEATAAIAKEIF